MKAELAAFGLLALGTVALYGADSRTVDFDISSVFGPIRSDFGDESIPVTPLSAPHAEFELRFALPAFPAGARSFSSNGDYSFSLAPDDNSVSYKLGSGPFRTLRSSSVYFSMTNVFAPGGLVVLSVASPRYSLDFEFAPSNLLFSGPVSNPVFNYGRYWTYGDGESVGVADAAGNLLGHSLTGGSIVTIGAVPEPSGLVLAAIGLIVCAVFALARGLQGFRPGLPFRAGDLAANAPRRLPRAHSARSRSLPEGRTAL